MTDQPNDGPSPNELRALLLDDDYFTQFTKHCMKRAEKQTEIGNEEFNRFYNKCLDGFTEMNCRAITDLAESQIEKLFLRSVVTHFMASGNIGVVVHHVDKDAETEIPAYRDYLPNFHEFLAWFKEHRPAPSVHAFFDEELARGRISADEKFTLEEMLLRYKYLRLEKNWHMSIQPRFPNVKVKGKGIRADIYFWVPSHPAANIIVECDGYEFHSAKDTFKNDRIRDRELKRRGYDVLRYSGSEIYNDPASASLNLLDFLDKRAEELSISKK